MDVSRTVAATRPAPEGAWSPAGPTTSVLEVCGLTKRYGDTLAVDGIDLMVRHTEIFALLGPNGALKTTVLEMSEGYRRPDSGSISVLGQDPARAGLEWRSRIGLVLQASKLPEDLVPVTAVAEADRVPTGTDGNPHRWPSSTRRGRGTQPASTKRK
jgi:ABC-2 type transport system ATP-binding protein